MADFLQATAYWRSTRDAIKQRVTITMNNLALGASQRTLSRNNFFRQNATISEWLVNIRQINQRIDDETVRMGIDLNHQDYVIDQYNETMYLSTINEHLAQIDDHFGPVNQSRMFKLNIDTPKFDANNTDPLHYKNFINQFKACVSADPSLHDTTKLTLLKASVLGTNILDHLSCEGPNYKKALDLLNDEFLDGGSLKNNCMQNILDAKIDYDPELEGHKKYLMQVRVAIEELKSTHEIDILNEVSGSAIVGYAVFRKLPALLKKELINKLGTNYPTINQILDNYVEVIKTIRATRYVPKKPYSGKGEKVTSQGFATSAGFPTQTQGQTKVTRPNPVCKLCGAKLHSFASCPKYNTYAERIKKCKELGFCTLCGSERHETDKCFGQNNKLKYICKTCKSNSHASALCPQYTYKPPASTGGDGALKPLRARAICYMSSNQQKQTFILPIITINVNYLGKLFFC